MSFAQKQLDPRFRHGCDRMGHEPHHLQQIRVKAAKLTEAIYNAAMKGKGSTPEADQKFHAALDAIDTAVRMAANQGCYWQDPDKNIYTLYNYTTGEWEKQPAPEGYAAKPVPNAAESAKLAAGTCEPFDYTAPDGTVYTIFADESKPRTRFNEITLRKRGIYDSSMFKAHKTSVVDKTPVKGAEPEYLCEVRVRGTTCWVKTMLAKSKDVE